jgi:hypothetical protein
MDVYFVASRMTHLNIVTVGCFKSLLNNRLLLKGILIEINCERKQSKMPDF